MKKIISLILCAVLVVCFSTVAMAADNSLANAVYQQSLKSVGINITSAVATKGATTSDDISVTVKYNSDLLTADSQVAILVYKLAAGETVPTESNICYIDQFNYSANGEYTFPLYGTSEDGTYNVIMGATGLDAAGTTTFTLGGNPPVSVMYGDINNDGRIRSADASLVLQHSVSLKLITDATALIAADVNGDGRIRSADASLILQRSVNLITKFPVENK